MARRRQGRGGDMERRRLRAWGGVGGGQKRRALARGRLGGGGIVGRDITDRPIALRLADRGRTFTVSPSMGEADQKVILTLIFCYLDQIEGSWLICVHFVGWF